MTEKKTTKLNIYQKINLCMKEAQYITKEKAGNGLRYSFASHDAVTKLLRPVFILNGVSVVPSVTGHTCEVLDGVDKNGNPKQTLFTTVQTTVNFVNIDDPKDCFSVLSYGYGLDNQDKGIGKSISYSVKYAMLKVLCLETGDDPERDNIDYDNMNAKITSEQAAQVDEWMDQTGTQLADFLKVMKIKLVDDLPAGRFDEVRAIFMKKIDKVKGVA